MRIYQFVLALVLAIYIGFSRLHHLRFLEREPMLTGILKVLRFAAACTCSRSGRLCIWESTRQRLEVQRRMRQRVGQPPASNCSGNLGYLHHGAHRVRQPERATTPRTQARKATANLNVSGEDAGSTSAANCATAIAPQVRRWPGIWKACFEALPPPFRQPQALFESVIIYTDRSRPR